MRRVVVALLFAGSGCEFEHGLLANGSAAEPDATPLDTDAPPAPLQPVHVGPGDGDAGTAPLTLGGAITIDTSAPSITGVTLPPGVTLDVRPQLGGGPDLAVLHVGALDVSAGAVVKIIGTRPLVIAAGGAVDVAGKLDAGAHALVPGAGGAAPGMGDGAGQKGLHETSNLSDSGGGGAGYGTAGAAGGAISTNGCSVNPGAAGIAYGNATIATLTGGSGGGTTSATACTPDPGGAGGGALQITSASTITIETSGQLLAGGGGGRGGTDCGQSDVNSGPGGGSGGAIVLEASAISNAGVIAANGGGGGGSSSTGSGSANPGQDGGANATQASGGTGPRANGGKGGAANLAATAGGGSACGNNGAGGGGAVGRIAASTAVTGAGVISPAAQMF